MFIFTIYKQKHPEKPRQYSSSGFSLIELLIVVTIITILSAISLPYLFQHRKLYRTEDQALKVMDLMREASQLAMTNRRPIRLEINLAANAVSIREENGAPNILRKNIPLDQVNEVRMDVVPGGITATGLPGYNAANFPIVTRTWTVVFQSNGTALNEAGLPVSSTLYFWPPLDGNPATVTPRTVDEVRAVTIFGGTGAVRYWRYMNAGSGYEFRPYQ